jgi:hypothetical protein|tara:strand:+ start:376 stop:723 length:348 start_codon:yes stop_codon:yes gene_type:complete
MLWIPGSAVLSIIGFLLTAGIFGASVWVVLRKESSPFQDGIWGGLAKCAVFQVVMIILISILVGMLGFWGIGLAVIVFLLGMNKVFGADFVESIMIVVANLAMAEGVRRVLLMLV